MNVLIVSGGRRADLVREWKKANRNGKVYVADRTKNSAASFFADGAYVVPPIGDVRHMSALKRLVTKLRISLVFSVIDTDLFWLAQEKESFKKLGCTVMVSSPKTIAIAADKRRTARFFESIGIKTPKTLSPKAIKRFPVFIKPADGSGSNNVHKVHSKKELDSLLKSVPNPLVMEYLDGKEYSVDCLCDFEGKPLCIIPRTRELTMSGWAVRSTVVLDKAIIRDAKKILEHANIIGPSVLQCMKTKAGIYFFECNPRFGGGSMLGIRAGGDFVRKILALMRGKKISGLNKGVKELSMAAYLDHVIYDKSGRIRS